ncbi:hybrid sensor histidine kinase/response regulator [Methylobacillus glycogenes]|uniref:hybrid sensor histidine kinase/response regulator n=1 Tax=Methylobacillus glycogenes TaxID=406 RepID=UPI00046FB3F5|nr:hybrid sensor histidine kinase/response regulator [Methylobacillus glycogenes]
MDGIFPPLKLVTASVPKPEADLNSDFAKSLRDLMGLMALPGLWIGRDGQGILQLTFEAIERTLPLRFIYSQVLLEAPSPVNLLMWDRRWESGEQAWAQGLQAVVDTQVFEGKPYEQIVRGEKLNIIRLSLGYGASAGKIWFGSDQPGFPTIANLAFIRAAITLAGTGILTAKAHQEAERANRAKDEFMAILGHELRNPLAPIMMSLDIMRFKNNGELPKELNVIDRQSKHLSRLVDDLLDISRITSGKVHLKSELVSLNDVLARAIENCTPLLNEKRHHLSKSLLADDQSYVQGDEYRLIQIFTNLLNNAAKFMGAGGAIVITSRRSGNFIEIDIHDQGPGIAAALLPTVFNMFEQGRQTLERSKGGLGIGLAVVKSLVELHQGRVQVESVEGQGATFSVILPLPAQRIPTPSAARVTPLQRSERTLLIVDDNEDALLALAAYLGLIGYHILTATTPEAALQHVAKSQPEVVILDIGLPGMSGYELAQEIQLRTRVKPYLIALTGYGQESDKLKSRQYGFDAHLTKPISFDLLNTALAQAVSD